MLKALNSACKEILKEKNGCLSLLPDFMVVAKAHLVKS